MENVTPIKNERPLNLGKPKNKDRRPREHLYEKEIEKLIKAAKSIGRHKLRDAALILITYRHGLRVSEVINLKWSQITIPSPIRQSFSGHESFPMLKLAW